MARFGYVTGWREGEIVNLPWDQVDHVAHEVRLYESWRLPQTLGEGAGAGRAPDR